MVIKLVREFRQNQQLTITPQLKKSIDLLQLSRLEIINKINNEIDQNPFLKKDYENDFASSYDNADFLENLADEESLQNHLENQLNDIRLNLREKQIALVIIQSLEENGLLQIALDEPRSFQQQGWQIGLQRYSSVPGTSLRMPSLLEMRHEAVQLKIYIESWGTTTLGTPSVRASTRGGAK